MGVRKVNNEGGFGRGSWFAGSGSRSVSASDSRATSPGSGLVKDGNMHGLDLKESEYVNVHEQEDEAHGN